VKLTRLARLARVGRRERVGESGNVREWTGMDGDGRVWYIRQEEAGNVC
jgi:hypothetical protein